LLDERHLARFQRESRIASALHHTNIVQVYGVGEQDGFHYYVMQYVRGEGLDRVMAHLVSPGSSAEGDAQLLGEICRKILGPELSSPLRRPEYYRATARIALQAAEALAYAHAQGTLHRDVKPANLLVDDQGVVWVADFGLARAAGASQVTQTGGVTGTLRYMAPERLRGQADERGDIYSLGLTLYELATLRPAYAQTDPAELIHEISRQPPARPGKVNPAVPKDLETVILKAIARESEHRYASAGALADDLRRFLEDRPVLARPIGPGERLWRWCRRNRALAALSAATLLSLLAVAGVATGGYLRTRAALDREALQRQRAEGVAKLALDAVDRVFARLGPARSEPGASITVGAGDGGGVEIASQVVPSKETAALLEEMLPFYDRLAGQTGDDLALQRRAADGPRRPIARPAPCTATWPRGPGKTKRSRFWSPRRGTTWARRSAWPVERRTPGALIGTLW
ncbi:MAG: serine/threonine-protein kinase, partial [Planctomycetota bacterium]|nr:serine/threonine-protein kinase [Planctomycetota bacterium]